MIAVGTRTPVQVFTVGPSTRVFNVGSVPVYYKAGSYGVSPTNNDGEIKAEKSLFVTAETWVIAKEGGAQIRLEQSNLPPNVGETLPNLLEFGAVGDSKTDNTTAINSAISSMPKGKSVSGNGGTIYAPPGAYYHEGEINLKELTGVHILGAGAQVGGGGIGVGEPLGATIFVCTEKQARCWDFRSSIGCDISNAQCFAWGSGQVGPIWDMSGTEAKPSALGHFTNARVEATRIGGKTSEEIVACVGVLLDYSDVHTFDSCTFSSCEYGVKGLATSSHSSVGHKFNSCFFAGNQKLHVANPQEAWEFNSCIAESLFNRKGLLPNSLEGEAGFIGYSGAGFKSLGLNLINCWSGSNVPATRKGANVSFIGEGLNVLGGSYNTGEIGFFFKEGCVGNTIQGVRFWKLNNSVYAEGAKTKDTVIVANRHTEIANSPAIGGSVEGKEYAKGCIIQEANEATLKVS